MAITKSILGMNARNFLYIRRYNKTSAKRIADDKLQTKEILIRHHLPTPTLVSAFHTAEDIHAFDWKLPAHGFVIKPSRGYGGGGILVIKSWDGEIATTVSGETYSIKQLESHLLDIFDGAYSLQFLPDTAYIEERVTPASFFKKLGAIGVPDIRIICFHKIPIMAMLRLPTRESKGKANLHLGAIGIGIDIRTGITTHALSHGKLISKFPETKTKIAGIKIPHWDELLLLAARTQSACGLGYAGVDMVIDEEKGPQVLEINARPGLAIQNANLKSLRTRLERVEDMHVQKPERGVEVAKSLFAEHFSEKVSDTTPKTLTVIQPVRIKGTKDELGKEVYAKLDTGAYRSSIDMKLAEELELKQSEKKVYVQSASGTAYRPTVEITFELAGRTVKTVASLVDRSHLKFPMIVGRKDLQGFLIKPEYGEVDDEDKNLDTEEDSSTLHQ
jgi:alpha-L-glutamate ligase-like protein